MKPVPPFHWPHRNAPVLLFLQLAPLVLLLLLLTLHHLLHEPRAQVGRLAHLVLRRRRGPRLLHHLQARPVHETSAAMPCSNRARARRPCWRHAGRTPRWPTAASRRRSPGAPLDGAGAETLGALAAAQALCDPPSLPTSLFVLNPAARRAARRRGGEGRRGAGGFTTTLRYAAPLHAVHGGGSAWQRPHSLLAFVYEWCAIHSYRCGVAARGGGGGGGGGAAGRRLPRLNGKARPSQRTPH